MICPCKGCETRIVGCHSKCKWYGEWKSEQDDIREKKHKEKKTQVLASGGKKRRRYNPYMSLKEIKG